MKKVLLIFMFPFISICQQQTDTVIACDLITDFERAKEFTLKYLNTMPKNITVSNPHRRFCPLGKKLCILD